MLVLRLPPFIQHGLSVHKMGLLAVSVNGSPPWLSIPRNVLTDSLMGVSPR